MLTHSQITRNKYLLHIFAIKITRCYHIPETIQRCLFIVHYILPYFCLSFFIFKSLLSSFDLSAIKVENSK